MPGLRILVVEPDPMVGELIGRNLEYEGAAVRGAGSLIDACRMVRAHGAPDVILLDIALPQLNPYDSLMVLRAVCRSHVPAGFLSRTRSPVPRFIGCPVKSVPFTSVGLAAFVDHILLPSELPPLVPGSRAGLKEAVRGAMIREIPGPSAGNDDVQGGGTLGVVT
ncbi:MAG: response regulator [Actinomycetota bacterium]